MVHKYGVLGSIVNDIWTAYSITASRGEMARTARPREFDTAPALAAAMQIFWRQGYEATSLHQLKQVMGDPSSASFYGAFGSKERLYREALARYLDTYGQVVAPLHDETLEPRDALEQVLRRSARMQTDPRLPKGCMVVLSAANASPENHHLQTLVAGERQRTRDAIRRCVERALAAGELRQDADAVGLAALAEALLVGMSVQVRDGVSHASIEAAVSNLLQLWDVNRTDDLNPRCRQR